MCVCVRLFRFLHSHSHQQHCPTTLFFIVYTAPEHLAQVSLDPDSRLTRCTPESMLWSLGMLLLHINVPDLFSEGGEEVGDFLESVLMGRFRVPLEKIETPDVGEVIIHLLRHSSVKRVLTCSSLQPKK